MASTTQKKKPAATKKRTSTTATAPQKRPIRREVWAAVCFFVGLFTFIGYFNLDALFITYICAFIKALIGYGYYLFPVAMLACAVILALHRGRPVRARSICMALVPVAIGALAHLLFCRQDFGEATVAELMPLLYDSGKEMLSGGLVCGLLADGLKKLFSIYGAVPVFFFAAVVLLMVALRLSPAKIAEKYKSRERPEYEYIPEPEPEPAAPARPRPANPVNTDPRNRRHAIDIPMDEEEPEEYREEKVGFFNKRARVKSPDQVL